MQIHSHEIGIVTTYCQCELINKCRNVFPMYFKSHQGISVTRQTRTIVPSTKYRIEQTNVHDLSRVFTETDETKMIQTTDVH